MTTDARQVVAQAREAIAGLQQAEGPVAGLAGNLKQTMDDARSAMSGFAENMDALNHNFLLRGFFNARGYFDLEQISPAEYRSGALAQRRTHTGPGLAREPSGCSKPARSTDVAAPDRRRPPTSGFGDGALSRPRRRRRADCRGIRARRAAAISSIVVSRARAVVVRDYLIGRFHLEPNATGAMPLGGESADTPASRTVERDCARVLHEEPHVNADPLHAGTTSKAGPAVRHAVLWHTTWSA